MGLPVVTESIEGYLAEISRYPVLSAEEEYEVATRYHKYGRVEDAHTLVTSNLRYVVKLALEYRHYGCKLADLIQEGNIGLMKAVKKFDPTRGFRLITYATWWIRSHIQEFILKSRGMVRRGTRALKKKLFYREAIPLGKGADADESARALALRDRAAEGEMSHLADLSLDAELGSDGTVTHLDMLTDTGPGPADAVSDGEETARVRGEVSEALGALNERERLVIESRVMSEEPASLQGLGDRLGVSRERVRQIESQALKKLRKALVAGSSGAEALPERA